MNTLKNISLDQAFKYLTLTSIVLFMLVGKTFA